MKKRILRFVVLLMCITTSVYANDSYRVIRGERPPIDYDRIDPTSYEKGVLIVKFNRDLETHLQANPAFMGSDGTIMFGIEPVDRLNSMFGVRSATQYFNSDALRNSFSERHRAWGFHLWYRLELDNDADIREMIRYYSGLRQVEVAEPVFLKELIGSHQDSDYAKLDLNAMAEDLLWTPNDPRFNEQWHYHNTGQQAGTPGADIRLPAAWNIHKGNPAVIVAVEDGGIDHTHADLAGNMWPQIGYNFVSNSPVIVPHNHGTHVAGTIAAVNNNAVGVSGIAGGSGFNDGVRLMSCQVFTASSNGGFHLAPIYAADNGAAISQNSWGYTSPNAYEQNVLDAIDYFNINGGGTVMDGGITIFAAGNSNSSSPYYPGYYSGTLAVAATSNTDGKAWYSNFGPHIDISAPGGETNTVTSRGVLSTLNGNTYGFYQGTSMACPHVSGVVALMLSAAPGQLSSEDVKDILVNTADDHYSANPGFPGQLGAGRLNAFLAVALSEIYSTLPSNPQNFEAQGVSDSQINLSWQLNSDSEPVILAWSPGGVFGIPQQGSNYSAGDVIEGGGVVIYAGSALGFQHTGLDAATLYSYKLWSVDDELTYSLGRSRTTYTLCGVDDMPFAESFSSGVIPFCWSFPQGQANWKITTAHGQPSPAVMFSWNPTLTNYSHALESPPINGDMSGDGIILQFSLMLDNYSSITLEKMIVQVFNGTQWSDVMTFTNSTGDIPWDTHTLNITQHAQGNIFMVRFLATGVNSYNLNHWVIDQFQVFSASCMPPSGPEVSQVTSTTALVNWQGESGTQWELKYGPAGFDPSASGTLIGDIQATTYLLSDLHGVTTYEVYVRTWCGASEQSLWTGPVAFTTLCDTFTLPFAETFTGSSSGCWSFPQGQGNWGFGSSYPPPSSQSGAPYATFTWNPSLTNYSLSLQSPLIQAAAGGPVKISYLLFLNNYNNASLEQMAVEYKAIDSQQWIILATYTNEGLAGGNIEHNILNMEIPGVQGKLFQVRFRAHGQNSYSINGWSLDDVSITQDGSSNWPVDISLIIEGPYTPGLTTYMHTSLHDSGLLPLEQPYGPELPYYGNESPVWYYTGGETVQTMAENVVDWVLVELRDAPSASLATTASVISRQAALLLNNGQVRDVNGFPLSFSQPIEHGLYVVVYHRNHLAVMSSEAVTLQDGVYTWDFINGPDKAYSQAGKQAYLQGQKHLGGGKYGLFGGDGDANGQIQSQDKNQAWGPFTGLNGYLGGDFDLNGQVQSQDKNDIWDPNAGLATQVP